MSVKDCSNAKLIELAYEKTPPTFDGRLSEGTKKFFIERNVIISTDEFVPLQNEIFKTLINRIGLTSFVNLSTSNPLSTFKSGSMTFGDTIQEISNDIIEGPPFLKVLMFRKTNSNLTTMMLIPLIIVLIGKITILLLFTDLI